MGQTYLELYLLGGKKDPKMIAPTQASLDSVIGFTTLKPGDPKIPWWWCDALFMAPPVWARMYAATGEHKYIDYLDTQWQRTSELLYGQGRTFVCARCELHRQTGANGKKIFWSRGEGWVMAGMVRTMQYLPKDDVRRQFYVESAS